MSSIYCLLLIVIIFQRSLNLKEAIFRINFAVKNLKSVLVDNVKHSPTYIFESSTFCELSSIAR